MKAIVGLGNPGREYEKTRHNVGFRVIDRLAERWGLRGFDRASFSAEIVPWRPLAGTPVWLAKPTTFMNLSGEAVGGLLRYYKIDPADLLVVVDEVQLPLGRLRLRRSGSAGGHNGLKSVIQHIGSDFGRLRIGVGRGDPKWDLADHVLSRFDADEQPVIDDAIGKAADAAEMFVEEGIEAAMNRFNARDDKATVE
jgi:peptidyl-tRNA hydrolase, PTH1 family